MGNGDSVFGKLFSKVEEEIVAEVKKTGKEAERVYKKTNGTTQEKLRAAARSFFGSISKKVEAIEEKANKKLNLEATPKEKPETWLDKVAGGVEKRIDNVVKNNRANAVNKSKKARAENVERMKEKWGISNTVEGQRKR